MAGLIVRLFVSNASNLAAVCTREFLLLVINHLHPDVVTNLLRHLAGNYLKHLLALPRIACLKTGGSYVTIGVRIIHYFTRFIAYQHRHAANCPAAGVLILEFQNKCREDAIGIITKLRVYTAGNVFRVMGDGGRNRQSRQKQQNAKATHHDFHDLYPKRIDANDAPSA